MNNGPDVSPERLRDLEARLRALTQEVALLRDERRTLAMVAARIEVAVVLTNPKGLAEWVNEAFTRLTGYTLEDLQGRRPEDLLAGPEADPATFRTLQTQFQLGQPFTAEILHQRKDGQRCWVQLDLRPIHDEPGCLVHFMMLLTDVTERRRALQRRTIQYEVSRGLGGSETLHAGLQSVLRAIGQTLGWEFGAFWRIDAGSRCLVVEEIWNLPSPRLEAFLTLTRQTRLEYGVALPGRVWSSRAAVHAPRFEPEDGVPRAVVASTAGLRAGVAFPVFVEDQLWGVIEFLGSQIEGPDNDLLRLFATIGSQISQFLERVEALHELEVQKALFERLFAEAPVAVAILDNGDTVRGINAEFTRLFGYEAVEAIDRRIGDLIVPNAQSNEAEEASRSASHGQRVSFETVRKTKSGALRPVQIIGQPVRLANNQLGVYGLYVDLTARKQAEAAIERAREEAEAANRAKSGFLAMMSHEIRTPMNSILGMASLLHDTALADHQREFVEAIRSGGEALLEIINDILDFSKIESERLTLEPEDFDLDALVGGVLELLAPRAQDRGIEFAAFIQPGTPLRLRGDDGRLRQILVNLASNGIKFTDRGQVVLRVSCVSRTDCTARIRFSVADTGIGIPKEDLARLFTPFTQVDSSAARRYGGTGLGLVISKRLVQLMGGDITVQSAPGAGSVFEFSLELGAQEPPAQPDWMTRLRALVVSPHLVTCDALTLQLQRLGLATAAEPAADPALERLHRLPADQPGTDIIFIDSRLPNRSWLPLAAELRNPAARWQPRLALLVPLADLAGPDAIPPGLFDAVLSRPAKPASILSCLTSLFQPRDPLSLLQAPPPTTPKPPPPPAPRPQATPAPPPTPPLPPRPATPSPLRILVAEDHEINRRLALLMLDKLGYRPSFVTNGREAVDYVARETVDVILMDCQMPEMDGFTATRAIRAAEAGRPGAARIHIIAMTANAMRGDREACLTAGMDHYISKPVRIEVLGEALREAAMHAAQSRPRETAGNPGTDLPPAGDHVPTSSSPIDPSEPNPEPGMDTALATLIGEFGDDAAIELIESFLRDTPERFSEVHALAAKGEYVTLARATHSIAGSSSIFGLENLRRQGLEVEEHLHASRPDQGLALIPSLEESFRATVPHLQRHLMRLRTGTGRPPS